MLMWCIFGTYSDVSMIKISKVEYLSQLFMGLLMGGGMSAECNNIIGTCLNKTSLFNHYILCLM